MPSSNAGPWGEEDRKAGPWQLPCKTQAVSCACPSLLSSTSSCICELFKKRKTFTLS